MNGDATIGFFLYPLGFLGLLGLLFFTERFIFLNKGRIQPKSFVQGIETLLQNSHFEEALSICEQTPGAVARLTKIALLHHQEPNALLRNILQQNALLELPVLRKRVESLRLIGQIAPLVGLIGSVFYLLQGFCSLSKGSAYTYLTSFAPLLVSALSVTLIGLLELFVFTLAYHFLNGRIRSFVFDLEWTASEWLVFFQQHSFDSNETVLKGAIPETSSESQPSPSSTE